MKLVKPDYQNLFFVLVFAIIWGYFADLRDGDIDGFIQRLILFVLISYLFQIIGLKFFNKKG